MRKIMALLVSCFIALHTLATDFTVTSNADSGPGTLRQALTDAAANGSATQDRIIFNIADQSEAGRTIAILSKLPDLSSNLDIDGSTQPGIKFGVSDAKVKIVVSFPDREGNFCLNIQGQTDIGIYGLLLDKQPAYYGSTSGIYVVHSKRINIGAPGKGNVIRNFYDNITFYLDFSIIGTTANLSEDVQVRSNFFGINEDGKTVCALSAAHQSFTTVKNLTFGGNDPVDGNVVFGVTIDLKANDNLNIPLGSVLVANNKIGIDHLGQNALQNNINSVESGFDIIDMTGNIQSCEVSNNVILGGMSISTGCFFTVKGNKFGTDITGTKIIPHRSLGITLSYSPGGGKIGGTAPDDKNIFAGCYQEPYIPLNSFGIVYVLQSPGVEVVGNVFKCNSGLPSIKNYSVQNPVPVIVTRTAASITGTGQPNSRVDLYYSLECDLCEPQQLFASVNTDATGNWSYMGALQNYAIIASATINGGTSEFTSIAFTNLASDVKIKAACSGQNGSIRGITSNGANDYTWYNTSGMIISKSQDLLSVGPGKYHLIISNGYCSVTSAEYEIKDASNPVDDSHKNTRQPSCANNDGSVTGLQAIIGSTFTWKDQDGNTKGNGIDIYNLKAGTYTLYINNTETSCTTTYGPITLANTTGPNIIQTNAIITGSNCGESTGSITGITVSGTTGTIQYTWKNAQGIQAGNTADLINQPSGNYTLQVNDGSSCGPVYSSVITIPQLNGVSIDEGNAVATPAVCGGNGSIDGFVVKGASASVVYRWYDQQDRLKGTTREPSFSTPSPGSYYMVASDGACSARSTLYTIGQQSNTTDYAGYLTRVINNATCGNNDGNITVNIGAPASADIKAYRWVTKPGAVTLSSTTNKLTNLDAGIYQLYITGNNNCEKLVTEFTVDRIAGLVIATDRLQVRADICNQAMGSITGLKINEVPGKPATCKWTDAAGNIIGTTPDLLNRRAGTYTLNVTDGTICGQTLVYAIGNNSTNLNAPTTGDIQLCTAGDALLNVSGVTAGYSYRLYNDLNSATPIDAQPSGKFKITVTGNRSYYVSQFAGDCESPRAEVKVILGGLSALKLPNAISPNGDGVNDTRKLPGIESYPTANVQIYTRSGQKVFESIGYATPFNGVYNGKPLAAGTYYYIINLNTGCSLLSGSLTIIR